MFRRSRAKARLPRIQDRDSRDNRALRDVADKEKVPAAISVNIDSSRWTDEDLRKNDRCCCQSDFEDVSCKLEYEPECYNVEDVVSGL